MESQRYIYPLVTKDQARHSGIQATRAVITDGAYQEAQSAVQDLFGAAVAPLTDKLVVVRSLRRQETASRLIAARPYADFCIDDLLDSLRTGLPAERYESVSTSLSQSLIVTGTSPYTLVGAPVALTSPLIPERDDLLELINTNVGDLHWPQHVPFVPLVKLRDQSLHSEVKLARLSSQHTVKLGTLMLTGGKRPQHKTSSRFF